MNKDLRVSVHCYQGDGHQVAAARELYTHHRCPVTVISPIDSQVVIDGMDCRFAGKREGSVKAWPVVGEAEPRIVTAGPRANMRQVEQMKLLLTYPEQWFFMNDADSFCIDAELPAYLRASPDTIWCNYVPDTLEINVPGYAGYPEDFPHAAMQPPYFMSRRSLERIVEAAPAVLPHPNGVMPWIDHFMLQLAWEASIDVQKFWDSVASDVDRYPQNLEPTLAAIRDSGAIFVHSSKSPKTWRPMLDARRQYLLTHSGRRA